MRWREEVVKDVVGPECLRFTGETKRHCQINEKEKDVFNDIT